MSAMVCYDKKNRKKIINCMMLILSKQYIVLDLAHKQASTI